jgi:hypothetical protein
VFQAQKFTSGVGHSTIREHIIIISAINFSVSLWLPIDLSKDACMTFQEEVE